MRITCLDLLQAFTLVLSPAYPAPPCSAPASLPQCPLLCPSCSFDCSPPPPPAVSGTLWNSPLQPPMACCLSFSLCDQTLSFCACVSRTQHQIRVTSLYLNMAATPSEVLGSQSHPFSPQADPEIPVAHSWGGHVSERSLGSCFWERG